MQESLQHGHKCILVLSQKAKADFTCPSERSCEQELSKCFIFERLGKQTIIPIGPESIDHVLGETEWDQLRFFEC